MSENLEPVKKTSASIGLINPKGPTNVGAVLRSADCFRADAIFYTGTRYANAAKFHTDTQGASKRVSLTGVDSLIDAVSEETKIVCVELVEGATSLPEFEHPENAFYIFGAEDGSIPQKVIDQADEVVYIPTVGCLNLAQTVNIVLYDRTAKSDLSFANDDLIKQSRDTNNKSRVRAVSK